MKIETVTVSHNGIEASLSHQSTRQEVVNIFGIPDDVGGFRRKCKKGTILKYGDLELHFSGGHDDSHLTLLFQDELVGEEIHTVLLVNLEQEKNRKP